MKNNNWFCFFKTIIDKKKFYIISSLIIGFLVFFAVGGIPLLNPQYCRWMMERDLGTHYFGWQFFRFAPFFQWPFGATPNFWVGYNNSIIYTDSLPLFAFFFKIFRYWLPENFQYFGFWYLIGFIFQTYFSQLILSKFTKDKLLICAGSLFFATAPIFLYRIYFHPALSAHWVILAGIYLYFEKEYSPKKWMILLVMTALIHAYLLAMVSFFCFVDFLQRIIKKEVKFTFLLTNFVLGIILTLFILWFSGYFMVGSEEVTYGFGVYRLNLLSFIDPADNPAKLWSIFLRDLPQTRGDYDGFNFWGLGILGLCVISIFELFKQKIKLSISVKLLFISCLFLFLFSISNKVAIGSYELFSYNVPAFLLKYMSMFRASGRFFWPVSYLVYFLVCYLLFKRKNIRSVKTILCCMLLIQLFDMQEGFKRLNYKFRHVHEEYSSFPSSPFWDKIADNYKNIIIDFPFHHKNWLQLSEFAVSHKMTISSCFLGRYDVKYHQANTEKLIDNIGNGKYSDNTLYFFANENLWNYAISHLNKDDFAGIKDGYKFIAPNLKRKLDLQKEFGIAP